MPTTPARSLRAERRWPVALAVLVMLAVLVISPSRSHVLPLWLVAVILGALIASMVGDWLSGGRPGWQRIEYVATLIFVLASELVVLTGLSILTARMLGDPTISGKELLASSVAAWVTNVVAFSILYWRIDRGGPERRALGTGPVAAQWRFPQAQSGDGSSPGWRPVYADYLFLSFCTATAFSPTDVLPLTVGAKLLMMVESIVSLATLVIVASRAINILGN